MEISELKPLPHIAIVLSDVNNQASVLAGLRKLTGVAFSELKDRIARWQPVPMIPLFDNQFYESGAAVLRAVVGLLEGAGATFVVYELAEGERFETRDENLSRITPDTLKNILRKADVE